MGTTKSNKKGKDKPKQTPNSICKSKNTHKKQVDKSTKIKSTER